MYQKSTWITREYGIQIRVNVAVQPEDKKHQRIKNSMSNPKHDTLCHLQKCTGLLRHEKCNSSEMFEKRYKVKKREGRKGRNNYLIYASIFLCWRLRKTIERVLRVNTQEIIPLSRDTNYRQRLTWEKDSTEKSIVITYCLFFLSMVLY